MEEVKDVEEVKDIEVVKLSMDKQEGSEFYKKLKD